MNPETSLTITKYDGLEVTSQTALELAFSPFYLDAQKLMDTARTINVTDVSQKRPMALARQVRLSLRDVRLAMLEVHKSQKADVLIKGRAIDALKNDFLDVVKPMEERLLSQEQFAERIEAAQLAAEQAALRQSRTAELLALGYAHAGDDLGAMPPLLYANVLADATAIKAEQDRAAAEAKAREEERLRLKEENERLQREAAEAKRVAEEERKRVAAEAAAVAAERARAKAEADRAAAAAEAARQEMSKQAAVVSAQLVAERLAREAAEADIKAAKKREADRAAAVAEAARLAALAPEREKLLAFAAALRALPVPDVMAAESIREQVEHFAKWVEELDL